MRSHQIGNGCGVNCGGAECINVDADRIAHTDGVRELNFAAVRQACGYDVFRHITSDIGGRAIDLSRILAAEAAAAMASHAAVAVDDYLATRQASVTHGAANYETVGGIDVVLGISVEHVGGNGVLTD